MSAAFRVADIARWCDGRIAQRGIDNAAGALSAVVTDSRKSCAGALFVALRGALHDAHDHLDEAVSKGAQALLVERAARVPAAVAVVVVQDTTRALGALAAGHRAAFDGALVAITGSNGKTTTKEMCAAILSEAQPTLRNEGNLNNMIGLPLTLLAREERHRALVVELGMNQRGEIAKLAAIAKPTVGVVTNVGMAHIEGLGTREQIALEKGDLLAALDASATAVVNADDALLMKQTARCLDGVKLLRFGMRRDADFSARELRETASGFDFELQSPVGATSVSISGLAETSVMNALAASAAAFAAGARLEDLATGLAKAMPPTGRMTKRPLAGGGALIDDSYNANPQSLEAALQSLARRSAAGVAVLGDMGELGACAERAHDTAGARAAELELGGLVALGVHAPRVTKAAVAAGMDPQRTHIACDHADAARAAQRLRAPGAWLLVKGSRAMHMERVVEALTQRKEGDA